MQYHVKKWAAAFSLLLGLAGPLQVHAQDGGASDSFVLGVYGGALVPRSGLAAAPAVGIEGSYALTPPLRIVAAVDWALLARQQTELLSPPEFPRAQAEFIQNTHVMTALAGVGYRLLELGRGELVAEGALALSVTVTEFEAFGATRADTDVGPGVAAQLALRYPVGPVRLAASVGYREALHDMGPSGQFGDETVSGMLFGLGCGFAL